MNRPKLFCLKMGMWHGMLPIGKLHMTPWRKLWKKIDKTSEFGCFLSI
jgi:hypothetical protein